jgi:alpha-galactosidase
MTAVAKVPKTLDGATKSMGRRSEQNFCRTTVNLSDRSRAALEETAKRNNDSKTDTINRAIQVYAYLDRVLANGDQIILESPDGDRRVLKFW